MKKVTTYFVSHVMTDFPKKRYGYNESCFEEGSAWSADCIDEEVIDIYLSLDDAKKKLATYSTTFTEFCSSGISYLSVDEYAIIERSYDLGSIIEAYEGRITNEEQFIEELKKDPWNFGDYEIYEESEDIWDFSKRAFTAEVRTDNNTYVKHFNNHKDAKDWLVEQEDKAVEDGILIDSQLYYY